MTTDDSAKKPSAPQSAVPRAVVDLFKVPYRDGVAAWHEGFGGYSDFKGAPDADDHFPMRTEAFLLQNVVVGDSDLGFTQFTRWRTRARVARDGQDFLALHFPTKGDWEVSGPKDAQHGDSGDMTVLDMAEPHHATLAARKLNYLTVPRRLLAPLLNSPDGHNMRVFRGDLPMVRLLRNHLQTLHAQASHMSLGQASAVLRPTLELTAAVLNDGATEENIGAVRGAVITEIKRFIDARLHMQELTPEFIAGAFGMSVRKLYGLFEPQGGVVAYIQRQRIVRIREAITDPDQSHKTIQEIAHSYGFDHRKSFVRAFRRVFGMSPREIRGYASAGNVAGVATQGQQQSLWEWLRDMH